MITGNTFFFGWEVRLIEWIQSWLGTAGTAIASFITFFGEEYFLVAILGFLYWCWDKEFGKYAGLNIFTGIVWNPMIKNVFLRRRPYFDNPGIKCLKPVDSGADIMDIGAQGFSFPSGHSTNSVISFGSIAVYKKQKTLWIIAIVVPLLVGISRFSVGVHFPTDVICGWLLGVAIIALMTLLQKKIEKKWLLYLIIYVISCAGLFYCRTNDYFTGLGLMGGFFLADIFEERVVKFESTKNVLSIILRMICGFAVYLGLNALLKLPFSKDFLHSATMGAYLIRTLRYTIVGFVSIGVYPMVFKFKPFK